MNKKIAKQLRQRKLKIQNRLNKTSVQEDSGPMLNPGNIHYEIADRSSGMLYGGVGAVQKLVKRLELDAAVNNRLHIFKIHNPYFESDHVLNIAYNILCNGECLEDIERLRNDKAHLDGVHAMRMPVDALTSNWAYMVMASLAWNLKAWFALSLPTTGRWQEKRRREKNKVLRMEFKTFRNYFIMIPCQIVKIGRKLLYRLWGWNKYLEILFRAVDVFDRPLRC